MHTVFSYLNRHQHLRRITVDLSNAYFPDEPLCNTFLMALRSLATLEELSIDGSLAVSVSVLSHLLNECPRLRTIRIEEPGRFRSKASRCEISLSCVLEFMRAHAHVRELPVCVNAPDLSAEDEWATFGPHYYGPALHVAKDVNTDAMQAVVKEHSKHVQEIRSV